MRSWIRPLLARPRRLGRDGLTAALLGLGTLSGCATLEELAEAGAASLGGPSTLEIVEGLKQALSGGAAQAVSKLASERGFSGDPRVRIPFPEEARLAANALERIGLSSLVEGFERRLNEGAEAGAKRALPIFEQAIRGMSFDDARGVLFGGEQAATDYFRATTYDALVSEFSPEVEGALQHTGAITAWAELSTRYNQLPLVTNPVRTDIVAYATERALDGLFLKVAEEEARIRADPLARGTALLEKVFGYAAARAE